MKMLRALAPWLRQKRSAEPRLGATAPPQRAILEELEPRILYSADSPLALLGGLETAAIVETRIAPAPAVTAAPHEFVFIDPRVADSDRLLADLQAQRTAGRALDIVMLDPQHDGIAQISEALVGQQGISAIHILSDGADGKVSLGAGALDAQSVNQNAVLIRGWAGALTADADVLIYGCDVAATSQGRALVESLAALTGADVAASADATGSARLGANWNLEVRTGLIETGSAISAAAQGRWGGTLSLFTVTNTNDSGAGSLRQALINANAMAGIDTITFNIAGSGVQTITLASAFPVITDAVVIDGTTQTTNVGDTNPGTFGAGGTVGVDQLALGTVERPEIEIRGDNSIANGFEVQASNTTIRGLAIYGFGSGASTGNIYVHDAITGVLIEKNLLGTSAGSFIDPGVGVRTDGAGIVSAGGDNNIVRNNLIAYNGHAGIALYGSSTGWLIENNEIRGNAVLSFGYDGVDVVNTSTGNTIRGNLITGSHGNGIDITVNSGSGTIVNNTVTDNGSGGVQTFGIALRASNNLVDSNIVTGNQGAGVTVNTGASGNFITANSIYGNGTIGIDLQSNADNALTGTAPYVTANDAGDADTGGNGLQNFPVLTSANSAANGTTVTGTVNSLPGRTLRIEFFATRPSVAEASGFGGGERYLGFATVTTDASGDASFIHTLTNVWVNAGDRITATATDLGTNDTSEFAANVAATTSGIIVVDTTSDLADGTTTSITDLGNARGADGRISLREAITAANSTANGATPDKIVFDISAPLVGGAHTFALASALPFVTDAIIIDGSTESGFVSDVPVVNIDGSALFNKDGLRLDAGSDGSTIRGLSITGFLSDGAPATHAISVYSNNNTVSGNYVGLRPDGSIGANWAGIALANGATNNLIGGVAPSERNVVSGNEFGIAIVGVGASNNRVQGNFIGVAADGVSARPNVVGIQVYNAANNNLIGGTAAGAGNLIANSVTGLRIGYPGLPATGVSALGNTFYSNSALAIDLEGDGVTPNDLGDPDAGPNGLQNFPVLASADADANGTTIVGTLNSAPGRTMRIEFFATRPSVADASGYGGGERFLGFATVTTDGSGNAAFNTTLGNVWLNAGDRVSATATDLGTNNTSEFAANVTATTSGIIVVDTISDVADGASTSITDLGNARGADGRISLREAITAANNTANGVTPDKIVFAIPGALTAGAHTIQLGSMLPSITEALVIDGTSEPDYAGTPLVVLNGQGSVLDGVRLFSGSNGSTIRGLVIQNFTQYGISVTASDGDLIAGNWIGLNTAGNAAAGNFVGVAILNSNGTMVGGSVAADRNVISGNAGEGVLVDGITGADGNTVRGNYIGTNASGSAVVGNGGSGVVLYNGAKNNTVAGNVISGNAKDGVAISDAGTTGNLVQGNLIGVDATSTLVLGNGTQGIWIGFGASGNTVGGSGPGDGNLVGGSTYAGIELNGVGTTGNVIASNFIGTDATGTLVADNKYGLYIVAGASNNLVGGSAAGAGNLIANSRVAGIAVLGTSSGNALLGNSIFANLGLGIDLNDDGATSNDAGDIDSGPNDLQNVPMLDSSAVVSGSVITITGSLFSNANTSFRIEFFASPTADGSGRSYLGFVDVSSDLDGEAGFAAVLNATVPNGYAITATATVDLGGGNYGSTSEFSDDASALANVAPVLDASRSPALDPIAEDAGAPVGAVGTSVSSLVHFAAPPSGQVDNVIDPDAGAQLGIAVTAADTANGTWWYSTDAGASWNALGAVGDGSARLLAADAATRLCFQPNANYNGTLAGAITFRAWDQTSGSNGALADTSANGGPTAFSAATDTASLVVTAVNDAPVITSNGGAANASVNVLENSSVVTTVVSVDPDGPAPVYSIAGGADAAKFTINSSTGALRFIVAPNFEAPSDAGADNVYDVIVQASDGNLAATQAIAVTVTDQAITSATASGASTVAAGSVYTLNLSADEDASSWKIVWGDGTIDTVAGNPSSVTHTFAAGNAGLNFNILVSATDRSGVHFNNDLIVPGWLTPGAGLHRYAPVRGAFTQAFGASAISDPDQAMVGPDGLLYVANLGGNNIVRLNPTTGAVVDTFVGAGSGGLSGPTNLAFGPDGNLYVASYGSDQVLRYNGSTGAFIDAFVSAGSGGLNGVSAIAFRADGNLYVASYVDGSILRFNATTGAFVDTFIAAGSGGLDQPEFMAWSPDGKLYVASFGTDDVKRYDGNTGAFIDAFVTAGSGGLSGPTGMAFGPDGNLYVAGKSSNQVVRYDGTTGAAIGAYVTAGSGGMQSPEYLSFLPSAQVTVLGNLAPVLDAGTAPTLAAQTEDSGVPVGAVGSLVSNLVDFKLPGGQVDNVTDANAGAQLGIAVTAADAANGTWWYSTDAGASWNALGAVGDGSARLLAADAATRLYFQPNANYNGTLAGAITFRAWDQTSGSNGALADTSTNGGTTAFSSATDTASLVVTAVNDAPVITSSGGGSTASVNVLENSTAVTTFTSSDVDGGTPIYSIAGGADAARFTINSNTGLLSFIAAPDYEAPIDAGANNVYDVTVQVSDGAGGSATQAIAVTVGNVSNLLTVTTTSDAADGDTSSIEALNASMGADGRISLREAIMAANNTANAGSPDRIDFNIAGAGVQTIDVAAALPTISEAVVIDGTTQPGFGASPLIRLDGLGAGAGVSGLTLGAGSSGSALRGLMLTRFTSDGLQIDSDSNLVSGNFVGTDGSAALGNAGAGMRVRGNGNTLGGSAAGAGNVVSGNQQDGIVLFGSAGNTVQGNQIGTDATGRVRVANGGYGLMLIGSSNNLIGGSIAGEGNVISGNGLNGVLLFGNFSTGNVLQGNAIGTDAAGTLPLANGWTYGSDGVFIDSGASGNLIGGTANGAGNLIAFSPGAGVSLNANAGSGNAVLGNSIRANGGLAIDLGQDGVTANDIDDADVGTNGLQNFPVLTTASSGGGSTTVSGSLNGTANSTFRIEFFSSPTGDATGHGEGQVYLGFTNVTTDGGGNASFSTTLSGVSVTALDAISATATVDLGGGNYGSTSEFALNVICRPNIPPTAASSGTTLAYTENQAATAVDAAITVSDTDSANLSSATIRISANFSAGQDTLAFVDQNGITGSWNAATGMLTLSGAASVADYQAALRSITYVNTSDTPNTATRTVSFVVNDGTADSNTATRDVSVTAVNDAPVGSPTMAGTAAENQTLTAVTSAISDLDGLGSFSYQWLRDGVAVSGATGSSYVLGNADVGARMSVQVSYVDGQATLERLTSAPTAATLNVNDAPVGTPTVAGTLFANQTLVAVTGGIADADGLGAFSYQWLKNGSPVVGATSASYVLGDADVGMRLSVQVSYTDGHGTAEVLTSAETPAVAKLSSAPVETPVVVSNPAELPVPAAAVVPPSATETPVVTVSTTPPTTPSTTLPVDRTPEPVQPTETGNGGDQVAATAARPGAKAGDRLVTPTSERSSGSIENFGAARTHLSIAVDITAIKLAGLTGDEAARWAIDINLPREAELPVGYELPLGRSLASERVFGSAARSSSPQFLIEETESSTPDDQLWRFDIVAHPGLASGALLSTGMLWWATRAGGMVAAMMASAPAWRSFDPLPILERRRTFRGVVQADDSEADLGDQAADSASAVPQVDAGIDASATGRTVFEELGAVR